MNSPDFYSGEGCLQKTVGICALAGLAKAFEANDVLARVHSTHERQEQFDVAVELAGSLIGRGGCAELLPAVKTPAVVEQAS